MKDNWAMYWKAVYLQCNKLALFVGSKTSKQYWKKRAQSAKINELGYRYSNADPGDEQPT